MYIIGVVEVKKKYIIIIIIVTLINILISLNGILFKEKTDVIEENINTIKKDDRMLSMMLETEAGSGNYEMTTRSEWPTEGYKFNSELSKCENGGELSWDDTNKKVLMSGNTSDRCYVYFDKLNEFYYSGVKYSAPYGYKISDWLNSEYNTFGYWQSEEEANEVIARPLYKNGTLHLGRYGYDECIGLSDLLCSESEGNVKIFNEINLKEYATNISIPKSIVTLFYKISYLNSGLSLDDILNEIGTINYNFENLTEFLNLIQDLTPLFYPLVVYPDINVVSFQMDVLKGFNVEDFSFLSFDGTDFNFYDNSGNYNSILSYDQAIGELTLEMNDNSIFWIFYSDSET